MGWRIFHRAGLAFCCRSRLSSNVRHHNMEFVALPAKSAAQSAVCETATARHSREYPALSGASAVLLRITGESPRPFMKPLGKLEANFFSASRQSSLAGRARSVGRRFEGINRGIARIAGRSMRRSCRWSSTEPLCRRHLWGKQSRPVSDIAGPGGRHVCCSTKATPNTGTLRFLF